MKVNRKGIVTLIKCLWSDEYEFIISGYKTVGDCLNAFNAGVSNFMLELLHDHTSDIARHSLLSEYFDNDEINYEPFTVFETEGSKCELWRENKFYHMSLFNCEVKIFDNIQFNDLYSILAFNLCFLLHYWTKDMWMGVN
ncbi:MAG: hypothetical protein LBH55_04350 [Mycoplasmataceae bacterium]|nr:hypothetical protein [Mycoplasmataceae bacterium]